MKNHARIRTLQAYLACIAPLACGESSLTSNPQVINSGGGIRVYWNADLRSLAANEGPQRFLVSVLGLTTVELLEQSATGNYIARSLPPPVAHVTGEDQTRCAQRTPIAVAALDQDGDGSVDAIVEDTCGAYLVMDIGSDAPTSVDWTSALPGTNDAYPFIEVATSVEMGETLATGVMSFVEFTTKRDSTTWSDMVSPALPTLEWVPNYTRLFSAAIGRNGSVVWLVQGTRQIYAIRDVSVGDWAMLTQQSAPPPNLVPFEAYDHFTPLSLTNCPLLALGVGLFTPNPVPVPRRLHLLRFPDDLTTDGQYTVQEVASDSDVVTLSAVPSEQEDGALIGVIGARGETNTFSLLQLSACDSLEKLAEIEFTFDFTTAPTPGFGPGSRIPRTNGVKLLGARDPASEVMTFVHYDGYDV